jgi:hypothetical protein
MDRNVGAAKRCKLSASMAFLIEPTRKSASTNVQHANMNCGSRFGPVTDRIVATSSNGNAGTAGDGRGTARGKGIIYALCQLSGKGK